MVAVAALSLGFAASATMFSAGGPGGAGGVPQAFWQAMKSG